MLDNLDVRCSHVYSGLKGGSVGNPRDLPYNSGCEEGNQCGKSRPAFAKHHGPLPLRKAEQPTFTDPDHTHACVKAGLLLFEMDAAEALERGRGWHCCTNLHMDVTNSYAHSTNGQN